MKIKNFAALPRQNLTVGQNILVTTNGYVEYGGDSTTKTLFSEQFVLSEDSGNYYVASNTFRWVKEIKQQ